MPLSLLLHGKFNKTTNLGPLISNQVIMETRAPIGVYILLAKAL